MAITVLDRRPAVLVIDGREVGRLAPGATVECRTAPKPVRFVAFGEPRVRDPPAHDPGRRPGPLNRAPAC